MSALFEYNEDHGAAAGSPAKGTTRSVAVTEVNWKNVDDSTTSYTTSPITAPGNSFTKYQFGKFTGVFNQVSDGLWAHTAGVLGANLTLKGVVTSTYATPATSTNAALTTDMTAVVAITSGDPVLFSTTGPEGAVTTAILSAAGYSQYLASQLQVAAGAAAGDIGSITLTLRYSEN